MADSRESRQLIIEDTHMPLAQCLHDFTLSYGLVLSLLLAGLVGGLTHCAGMCSPFVLAQVPEGGVGQNGSFLERLSAQMLLPYHLGRMTTYVLLGVVAHSFINMAFLFSGAKVILSAVLLSLAGLLFFVSAFPALAQLFPWLERVKSVVPYEAVARLSAPFMRGGGVVRRYMLGVVLGFMPCGLVVSALMASATAASVGQAALAMAAFTLGTMPALVAVALGGGFLRGRYPAFGAGLSRFAMVASALWLFVLAGLLVMQVEG